MNKSISILLLIFILSFSLLSCSEDKVEYFTLNLIVTQCFGFEEGEQLNPAIQSIIGYYYDHDSPGKTFIPIVRIIRADLTPQRCDSLEVPLSFLNELRKSINLSFLSGFDVRRDYDANIPNILTPHILCIASENISPLSELLKEYPSAMPINLSDTSMTQIDEIRDNIFSKLVDNKNPSSFVVILGKFNTGFTELNRANESSDCIRRSMTSQEISLVRKRMVEFTQLLNKLVNGQDTNEYGVSSRDLFLDCFLDNSNIVEISLAGTDKIITQTASEYLRGITSLKDRVGYSSATFDIDTNSVLVSGDKVYFLNNKLFGEGVLTYWGTFEGKFNDQRQSYLDSTKKYSIFEAWPESGLVKFKGIRVVVGSTKAYKHFKEKNYLTQN